MQNITLLINSIFILPLIAVIIHLLMPQQARWRYHIQFLFCSVWLLLIIALFYTSADTVVVQAANWPAPFGISLIFDTLSKIILCVFAIVTLCINCFSYTEQSIKPKQKFFYIGYWLIILAVSGALTTGDIFNLYVWFELILVSAFILLSCASRPMKNTILHYAVLNIIGTLLMLSAIALLYGITGSLSYAQIAIFLQENPGQLSVTILVLLLFAIGVKGGLFPLYFWLPKAYPRTSCSSTLLLSSLVTKVVMVVLLRLVLLWPPLQSDFAVTLLIMVACCTMFFGVMGAASQFRIRDILCFHIISQLGYVLLGIVISTSLAIVAAVYFLIHNIFIKTGLLISAGVIEQQLGSGDFKKIGQVMHYHKIFAIIFFILAMSLAGFPPLSGFWGKFLLLKAAVNAQYYLSAGVAMLVSLFTLYSMLKLWRYVFCQANTQVPIDSSQKIKLNFSIWISLLPLLILSLYISLWPDSVLHTLTQMSEQLIMFSHYT
jgi:multicomponent Na+:H+ antiporter subunit D